MSLSKKIFDVIVKLYVLLTNGPAT
jgi:hypothetical protein